MTSTTIGCRNGAGLPLDHTVEDHLDAERAALAAERRAAAPPSVSSGRWMLVRAAGLGLALAGTIAVGVSYLHP